MGRKKTEFTTEQDVRITQMVNDGHSLNEILVAVNSEFETNFSRSGIDRRIKSLGIERTKHNAGKNGTSCTSSLNPKMADKVEELKEWKRKQVYTHGAITEQQIANAMGICVKTLKKMYKQFDIPQRLYYRSRPDIYFDVLHCDCTTLKKKISDRIYDDIMKIKPKDMRVEHNVIVHTEPMTIKFEDENYVIRTAEMNGTDLKVEFYFPDYKTAFYCCFNDVVLTNDDVNVGHINVWSEYLERFKNGVKLIPFVPMFSPNDRQFSMRAAAQTMIDRAISGEYNQWKS
jgi:hypothetical protein